MFSLVTLWASLLPADDTFGPTEYDLCCALEHLTAKCYMIKMSAPALSDAKAKTWPVPCSWGVIKA